MVPNAGGAMTENPIGKGFNINVASDGTIEVTVPNNWDDKGRVVSSVTLHGTWKLEKKLDRKSSEALEYAKSSIGFEYVFSAHFPSYVSGKQGAKARLLLGDLSGGGIPNNPDALKFTFDIGLQGMATIGGVRFGYKPKKA